MDSIKRRIKNKWVIIYISTALIIVLLNVAARSSKGFSNAYIEKVLPILVSTYGRLMGIFPFSVGEIFIGAAVVLVAGAVILLFIWLSLFAIRLKASKKPRPVWQKGFAGFSKRYFLVIVWTLLGFFLLMTLNCFIMYHGSTFSEMYFQTGGEEYTLEELIAVRNYVVEQCNRLSGVMVRDSEGQIIYHKDIREFSIETMQSLGETYPRLKGYYPYPKPLAASDFCSQQYILGYYFPFSMEANYNDVMQLMNYPATMCHELAHLRGYILEDEANFIGFLACVNAEDDFFVYSGYLSVLNYLDNDFYKAIGRDNVLYGEQPAILSQVREDNVFLTSEEWERIESKAWFKTETVDAVSDALMDASLKANGVRDGMISYSRVVGLVMQYYREAGFVI